MPWWEKICLLSLPFCLIGCGASSDGGERTGIETISVYRGEDQLSTCKATKVARNSWITASHCFPPQSADFTAYRVAVSDQWEDLSQISFSPSGRDLAVIHTANEIPGDIHDLSFTEIKIGDELTLLRESAEEKRLLPVVLVTEKKPTFSNGLTFKYNDVLVSTQTSETQTCPGDSGSSLVNKYNEIVAIHTAGSSTDCHEREKNGVSYDSPLSGDKEWLQNELGD